MSDLEQISAHNVRVSTDKAWERSLTRRAIIALGTYLVVGIYLQILGVSDAWLHAFVPAGAYLISTLCLSRVKPIWVKHIYKSKEDLA